MEKINVAELLKDCPQGMELDCSIFENLEFDRIDKNNETYPIICRVKTSFGSYNYHTFTEYGCYSTEKYSKCTIFPKGKTTWEGFQRPFKDGDIVLIKDLNTPNRYIAIFKNEDSKKLYFYNTQELNGKVFSFNKGFLKFRLATEKEIQKLFQAIKDNGYRWNAETKTLEKLIEPYFKIGDRIRHKTHIRQGNTVTEIKDTHYILDDELALPFTFQYEYELVPNKFDITTLKPFNEVLVRDRNTEKWRAHLFSSYYKTSDRPYICIGVDGLNEFKQCIPYDSNKELLDTTNDCDEFYKTW